MDWKAGATPGNSTITITSGDKNSTTLWEGEDFSIGPDGKAYYLSQPKISVRDVYGNNQETKKAADAWLIGRGLEPTVR